MIVRVRAPAKVNLYLRVGPHRADGYHELETVFHTIGLYDDLAFAPASALTLTARGLPTPRGDDNLCLKAARLLAARARRPVGARITLVKRIPSGAGLGGGSADAAACLVGLNRLWRLGLPRHTLHRLALRLGSDVPFFLLGGAALGRGRGERLTRLQTRLRAWAAILKPSFSISTRVAYAALDGLPPDRRTCPAATVAGVARALRRGDLAGLRTHNDFAQPAETAHRLLARLREGLLRAGAATACLTGSGSAVVGCYATRAAAAAAGRRLGRRWRVRALIAPLATLRLRPATP